MHDLIPEWGLLGEMGLDWRGQMDALLRDGYTGWVSLETHWRGPDGNRLEASRLCGARLRDLVTRRVRARRPATECRPIWPPARRRSSHRARRARSTASRPTTGSSSSSRRAAGCSTAWTSGCSSSRRESALKELLPRRPASAGRRSRRYSGYATTSMILGWATGGIIFGMMSDKIGRVKTMVVTLLDLLGLHGPVGARAGAGWTSRSTGFSSASASAACSARRRRSWRRACRAQFRAVALGSLQALSAVGNIIGSLVSLQIPPGAARVLRRLLRLARAVLRRHAAGAARRADHVRAQGARFVAAGARRRRPRAIGTHERGSPLELFRDPRWRRNTHRRPLPRRVRDDRALGHRLLLAGADLDRARRARRRTSSIACADGARRFRTSGSFFGHDDLHGRRGVAQPPPRVSRRARC